MTPELGPSGRWPACSGRRPRRATRSGSASRSGASPRRGRSSWQAGERVEALGFASLFANDHLMPILGDADGPVLGSAGPVFEGWMTLGAWAARTTTHPARRDGLRSGLPQRGPHGQDGDRARSCQRRPGDAGPRRRLARARAPRVRLRDAPPGRPDQPTRRGEPAGPRHARRGDRTARTVGGSAPTTCATIRHRSRHGCRS